MLPKGLMMVPPPPHTHTHTRTHAHTHAHTHTHTYTHQYGNSEAFHLHTYSTILERIGGEITMRFNQTSRITPCAFIADIDSTSALKPIPPAVIENYGKSKD